jgi:membrane protein YdbS with pleckstrin-like domain
MRGANDNADTDGGGPFRASATALFVPVLATAVFFGLPLVWLMSTGNGEGSIGRLCMVALGLGLPFQIAYAILRRATVRVDTPPHGLIVHPGFPSTRQHEIPYGAIEAVEVRRGLGGSLGGSSTLVVTLVGGHKVAAADLADGEAVRVAIAARVGRPERTVEPPLAGPKIEIARILAG